MAGQIAMISSLFRHIALSHHAAVANSPSRYIFIPELLTNPGDILKIFYITLILLLLNSCSAENETSTIVDAKTANKIVKIRCILIPYSANVEATSLSLNPQRKTRLGLGTVIWENNEYSLTRSGKAVDSKHIKAFEEAFELFAKHRKSEIFAEVQSSFGGENAVLLTYTLQNEKIYRLWLCIKGVTVHTKGFILKNSDNGKLEPALNKLFGSVKW